MKIKCVLVDDEELARKGLQVLLANHKHIEVLKSCSDGLQAIDTINTLKPDLVLLDIQMPGINGFEVIGSINDPKPTIIFITAHDQFAIKAFEVNAIDYLLKPFSDERFEQALDKAIKAIENQERDKSDSLTHLIAHTREGLKGTTKLISGLADEQALIFKADGQIHKVAHEEISHIEAFDYYIKVHIKQQFYLVRESMKKLFEKLPEKDFVRVHKSFIVNLNMIRQFGKSDDGKYQVSLINGQNIKVSRSYKSEVQKRLS